MDYFDRPEVGLNVLILDVQSKRTEFPELPELSELVLSAGFLAKVVVTATIDKPNPKWFVGKGKVNELQEIVAGRDVHLLVVNCEISGAQHRNLEKFLQDKFSEFNLLRESNLSRSNFLRLLNQLVSINLGSLLP